MPPAYEKAGDRSVGKLVFNWRDGGPGLLCEGLICSPAVTAANPASSARTRSAKSVCSALLQLRSRRCSCLAHRTPNRAHVAQGWFPSHRIFRLRHRSQAIIEDFRLCRVMAGLSCMGSPIVARLCKGRRFRSSALTASVGEEAAVDMMMTLAAASSSSS